MSALSLVYRLDTSDILLSFCFTLREISGSLSSTSSSHSLISRLQSRELGRFLSSQQPSLLCDGNMSSYSQERDCAARGGFRASRGDFPSGLLPFSVRLFPFWVFFLRRLVTLGRAMCVSGSLCPVPLSPAGPWGALALSPFTSYLGWVGFLRGEPAQRGR